MSPLITTRAGASAGAYGWGAASGPSPAFESIQTFSASGGTSYTFSSIPQTFKHLQVRFSLVCGAGADAIYMRANADTGSNYAIQGMWNTGATYSLSTTQMYLYGLFDGVAITDPVVNITDILDYTSTTKNKTFRIFSGQDRNGARAQVSLASGLWMSTTAITSLTIRTGITMNSGSIALYGIRG